jgi:hypothetical protein
MVGGCKKPSRQLVATAILNLRQYDTRGNFKLYFGFWRHRHFEFLAI